MQGTYRKIYGLVAIFLPVALQSNSRQFAAFCRCSSNQIFTGTLSAWIALGGTEGKVAWISSRAHFSIWISSRAHALLDYKGRSQSNNANCQEKFQGIRCDRTKWNNEQITKRTMIYKRRNNWSLWAVITFADKEMKLSPYFGESK